MNDVDFREAFEATIRTGVQPSSAAEVDRLVEATLSTPPEIVEETRAILGL
jgi:hypothetical protein